MNFDEGDSLAVRPSLVVSRPETKTATSSFPVSQLIPVI